jgi:glutathione peroxidase
MPLNPEIELTTIDGRRQTLADYAGKALLVVNVASQCGLTPQYAGLEALQRAYAPRGFDVLGFPCDQFGHQEPGDEAAISDFCSTRFDVTFPMFAKIEVNGANAHPLFQALKRAAPDGEVLRRYAPTDAPQACARGIEAALQAG